MHVHSRVIANRYKGLSIDPLNPKGIDSASRTLHLEMVNLDDASGTSFLRYRLVPLHIAK